jgi:hypothetical protein
MEIADTLKALSILMNPVFINQPHVGLSHKFVDSAPKPIENTKGIGGNTSRKFNLLSLNILCPKYMG